MADAETRPEDEVEKFEQYLGQSPTTKLGAGSNVTKGNQGSNFFSGVSKPARVSFEGNVGVGKSSILKLLQSHPRLQEITEILQEPIWEWQNVSGSGLNMLDAFYKSPKRFPRARASWPKYHRLEKHKLDGFVVIRNLYAYLFQTFVFTTRFLQQNAAASKSKVALLLMERSVLTDRCVFVETATEQGYFNPLEAAAYDAWYDGVVTTLPNVVPDAFVYLRADPNVCYERLKARARSEEAEVSLDYLQSLHSKHEKWFIESAFNNDGNWDGKSQAGCFSSSSKTPSVIRGRPVFVVDCTNAMEFNKPSKEVDRVVDEIVSFLLGPSKLAEGDTTA